MEPLRMVERQFTAAQQALEGAHQVVMAEETQTTTLAKTDAHLVCGMLRFSPARISGGERGSIVRGRRSSGSCIGCPGHGSSPLGGNRAVMESLRGGD